MDEITLAGVGNVIGTAWWIVIAALALVAGLALGLRRGQRRYAQRLMQAQTWAARQQAILRRGLEQATEENHALRRRMGQETKATPFDPRSIPPAAFAPRSPGEHLYDRCACGHQRDDHHAGTGFCRIAIPQVCECRVFRLAEEATRGRQDGRTLRRVERCGLEPTSAEGVRMAPGC